MSQNFTDDFYNSANTVDTDMSQANVNFAALKSSFEGSTDPGDRVAGMWWFNTATKYLYLRDEANNQWQYVWDFANGKPVIDNLSDEITNAMCSSALKDPVAGTAGLRTLGTGAQQATPGNDIRFTTLVDQAALKTSTQSQSNSVGYGSYHTFTLTGGQYCFRPTCKGETGDVWSDYQSQLTTSYTTQISLYNSSASSKMGYVIHRYITSSGETNWLFILREKDTKKIVGSSLAPDHPCFGNGGKPLLVSHPFGNYDETKHEIIVINPSNAEVDRMEKMTIVEDESLPDKDILEIITENYEIDEGSNPPWTTKAVTVSLPKFVVDKKTKKKVLADYRFMSPGTKITPIKKVIPKPEYIKVKSLKRKK